MNGRWSHVFGNPGLKLRLTQKGAEYLKNVGVKLLNEQLSSLRGFYFHQQIMQPGLPPGQVYISDIRTLGYRPPTFANLNFVVPSYLVFDIRDAAIT